MLLSLQTRRHKVARGLTAEEVEKVLKEIQDVVKTKIANPKYVMDHPPIHEHAHLGFLKKARHPRYDPDFNKPVEHLHGDLARRFEEWLDSSEGVVTPQQCMDQLEKLLYETPVSFFGECIRKMPDMWDVIAKPVSEGGVDGGWAPTPVRK